MDASEPPTVLQGLYRPLSTGTPICVQQDNQPITDSAPEESPQALQILTTLQYLAEVGPKSPPAGQITQSVQSIMRPLQQVEISFMPHAMLGYAPLTR